MTWTVYGDVYETAGELTDQSKYQAIIMPANYIVKGVRTWVIFVDDPTFSSLSMEIYSNNGGAPGKLLHTSTNSLAKATIFTDNSANKEIYFNFDDANLKGGDTYHLVLTGSGYSPSGSSIIAWRVAWPDPVYTENYTPTTNNLGIAPKMISAIIGGEL